MKKNRLLKLIALVALLASNFPFASATGSFYNPIRQAESPDPWIIRKDGFYYFMVTTGDGVWIHKSDKLEDVGNAARTKVWSVPDGAIKRDVWAPELHYLNGRWYIYASGSIISDGQDQRMFVLEGDTTDALKPYKYIGLLNGGAAAIDEDVWQDPDTKKIYMTWSQWAPDQSIYIAELTSPTTLSSNRVKLSSPTAPWEQKGWNVNEGPAFIKRNNKLHIVFSVSGCSTSDYALARLTCSNGDYLNPSAWVKTTGPVFARSEANRVWGVGHHAFTKSPDGTEDWLVYHAKASQVNTNADRSSRIQIFTWDANDNPVFGEPYPVTMKLPRPSDGTGTKQTITFDALPNKTINDASFTIAATASSGLPVTLRVQSGPATITNGVVQLSGTPGTVRIYASQEGDGTYCAAWPVFREFKVTSSDVKPGDGDGLTGSYYNGLNWDTKVLDRVDPNVNFDWGLNNPALGVNADNFSVKWKGYIMPLYTDIYNFSLISDNGRSLKVNNFTIIDHFESDWGKEYVGSVSLTAGKRVPIEINYKEENGGANIKLYWWSNNQTKKLVPKSQLFTTLTSSNVSEVPAPKLDVFPNPARNTVTVLSPNALDQVSILNSLGNIVQKYQVSGCSECTCDVEQLPDGVYYILAKGDNSVNTQKLIIRR